MVVTDRYNNATEDTYEYSDAKRLVVHELSRDAGRTMMDDACGIQE